MQPRDRDGVEGEKDQIDGLEKPLANRPVGRVGELVSRWM